MNIYFSYKNFIGCCVILFSSIVLRAQHVDSTLCRKLQELQVQTTIVNSPFGERFFLSKDSLKSGFEIQISDRDYKILGFRAYYLSDDGDIYFRDIQGYKATPENFPILKFLKGGELIEIYCINIQKLEKVYNSKPFYFLVGK